ncbi:CTP synthase [Ectocarpus siliculosus]|uniref:CTP synthase n=1 Tax=Ectocarpus siliculosus TaxID=2880 RepID=D7G6L2_ECTSI|nr:CTP synthase [Ectocarpus siliculosus]|eukprot:CBJ33951.1 CTP synthase [Ectocarpus siliculosus]
MADSHAASNGTAAPGGMSDGGDGLLEPMKYIVVTGGVVSGLGKGVTISSIGRMLKNCGLRTTSIKIDPYLNTDAGTMSPFEHGEVFVLDDGGEADLDLGNYERFLGVRLSRDHNITTGKVYQSVISKERKGEYLGKTVQVVPHITDEIQAWIERVAEIPVDGSNQRPDVCLIEVGGTVGDIESSVFLEALRQFQFRVGRERMSLVHVTLVPVLGSVGEQKTKPTQQTVRELRSVGLHPDVICCRSAELLEESTRNKISIFCQVPATSVLTVYDVTNIYKVPLVLVEQEAAGRALHIGRQALKHSAVHAKRDLQLIWVEASDLEVEFKEASPDKHAEAWNTLKGVDGVVLPGGFGTRGVEGKILTAKWARETGKPLLGVCLGFQCMVVEHCRSLLGWEGANSTDFHWPLARPTKHFDEFVSACTCDGSYEVNPEKIDEIEAGGLEFVGRDESGLRMEIAEIPRSKHPYYVGTQYHPEFLSRPLEPSPPFLGLLLASSGQMDAWLEGSGSFAPKHDGSIDA